MIKLSFLNNSENQMVFQQKLNPDSEVLSVAPIK